MKKSLLINKIINEMLKQDVIMTAKEISFYGEILNLEFYVNKIGNRSIQIVITEK